MADIAKRDANRVPSLLGVSSSGFVIPTTVAVNPSTHAMLVETSPSGTQDVNLTKVGGTAFALGQTTMTASLPVVIASDQSTLNVLIPDATVVTGNITNTESVVFTNNGYGTIGVNVAGTYTGTISVEGSVDGTNYSTTTVLTLASGSPISSITSATGNYQANIAGLKTFRLRGNTVSSGTANITLRGSIGVSNIMLDNSLPTGSNTIGNVGINGGSNNIGSVNLRDGAGNALTSNSTTTVAKVALDQNIISILGTAPTTVGKLDIKGADGDVFVRQATGTNLHTVIDSGTITTVSTVTNLSQMNGAAITMGNGVSGTGVQRVTIASDSTGQIALASGTNTIGGVNLIPATTGGLSTMNATSSDGATPLTNSAQVIKASAGQLFGYYIYNPNATAQFVQFYNTAAASVTVGTTNPLFMLTIPATSAANLMGETGIPFSNAGWSWAATSTAGGNGAPSSALDAVCFYK